MNTRRLLTSVLALSLGVAASAQDAAELAALRAKAEKGNGIAQYNLGLAYTRGGDVPADPIEGFVWLSIAQANGARGKALETLVASMDQPTLLAAQQRLAERRAQLGTPAPEPASVSASAPAADDARNRELSARITELAAEVASLRSERDRLTKLVADHEKAAQAAAVELTSARNFGQQVESTLNKVNDEKAALEAQLRSAQTAAATSVSSAPAEAAAATSPAPASTDDVAELQKKLAETEDKLATALRGYSFLQRQTDEKAAAASKSSDALQSERDSVVMRLAETDSRATTAQAEVRRLNEELEALRRSSAKDTADLAALRAVARQLQGTNTMLARENYELKARLAPEPAPVAGSLVGSTAPTPIATETTAEPAPLPAAVARTHVVVAGDSLSKIAQRYYNDSKRWPEIYQANREKLANESSLRVGAELRIP